MMLSSHARTLCAGPKSFNNARSQRLKAKKLYPSIDTNITSYDRKDPFGALDTLRKLLSSLTTRVGGCQLKLTPEEHKLSVHLLTIVEPFVGTGTSRRSFMRQPTEILDEIVSHIDSKRDLFALAISCKRMHSVIFPRHYDYRTIRCKISNIAVWGHLANNRALALNVRRLEILDERTSAPLCIPSDLLTTDTELESSDDELEMHNKQERLFISALTRMNRLNEFIWSCNHSLVSLENVLPTLLKCQTLKSVEINDNLIFAPKLEEDNSHQSRNSSVLPQLSSVAVRSIKKGYGQSKVPRLQKVSRMLHQCPNLEVLDINYSGSPGIANPFADDLFLFGRWPCLRSLNLTHLSCTLEGIDAATTFFAAHTNIEVLHLDVGPRSNVTNLVLRPGSFPRLRELKSSKELACAIMSCPLDSTNPRPIETIKGVRLTGQGRDLLFFNALRRHTVKRIELDAYGEFDDIKRLIECSPKVTWLDIGKKGSISPHKGPVTIQSVVDWANLLTQLPDLTTFHGVPFFYEVSSGSTNFMSNVSLSDRSRIKKNDEITSILTWKCPNLRRLDHWDEHAGKVIVLSRVGDKVKWEVRRVRA